jgi:hypothetical protein
MKRIAGILMLGLAFTLVTPALFAQEEHGEFGVFADYTRLGHLNGGNFWGPGGQIAFNLNNHLQLEGGMAYLPERTINTGAGNTTSFTTTQSGLRLLSGLFGPKIQTGVGPIKLFAVLKGGFLNFNVSNRGIGTGFTNAVGLVPGGDTNGVFYPGGGIEAFAGHIGIRAEAGDEMYFDRGANHNLRIAIGPQFRW